MFLRNKATPNNQNIRSRETCLNPWNHGCKNTDIAVAIRVNGEVLPICFKCWNEIADSDKEWGG